MEDLLLSRITDPTSGMILTCDCGGVWAFEATVGTPDETCLGSPPVVGIV